jgi:hypothetical protein
MKLRRALCALALGVALAPAAARAQSDEPGRCPNDSKLLNGGPTLVYGEGEGTYWGLEATGLDQLFGTGGGSEADKINYLSQVFGVEFQTLEEARDFNLSLLSATFDQNQNGYVCVYEQRGTRAYRGELYSHLTFFGVSDDIVRKKQ